MISAACEDDDNEFNGLEKLLSDLVSIDTIKEDNDFIQYVENLFPKNNKIKQKSDDGSYTNLLLLNDLALHAIETNQRYPLFCGHSDTVPVEKDLWNTLPHELTQIDNKLYGIGSSDMKGGIAAAIDAMRLTLGPSGLLITNREEIGLLGAKDILERDNEIKRYLSNADMIIAEPTNMEVGIRHKGSSHYKVLIRGKGGHSSKPYDALNPLIIQADLTLELNKFGIETYKDIKNNFSTGMSIAVTKNIGGDMLNVIPESCELYFNIRTIDENDIPRINDFMEKQKSKYEKQGLILNYERIKTGSYFSNNNVDNPNGLVSKSLKILQSKPIELPYGTDASFLSKIDGIECIICGPGDIGVCHQPNEYIEKAQLVKAKNTYQNLIASYAIDML